MTQCDAVLEYEVKGVGGWIYAGCRCQSQAGHPGPHTLPARDLTWGNREVEVEG